MIELKEKRETTDLKYKTSTAINNSILRYLKDSPSLFKRMLDKPEESSSDSFLIGDLVHNLVLTPMEFEAKYIVSDVIQPSSKQQLDFAYEVYRNPSRDIIEVFSEFYSTKNKSEAAISKEAQALYTVLNDYIVHLRTSERYITISSYDYFKALSCKNALFSHTAAKKLLFSDQELLKSNKDLTIFVENPFYFNYLDVDCKMKTDKVIIDHSTKTIKLIDLKTTSKSVYNFKQSFIKYDYGRQLGFYSIGLGVLYPGYEIDCFNIVIGTNEDNDCAVFRVPHEELEPKIIEINQLLEDYKFYLKKGFKHHKSYYENSGIITLNLEKNVEYGIPIGD